MFIILFQRIKKRPSSSSSFYSSNLFSFYLFLFILICKLINLINSSGQLLFQLTTFNISEQIKIELCANEFRWPSKNEWGKDCKFGKAEIYLIGNETKHLLNTTTTTTTKTLIQTTTKTTSISLPFTHYWRQSFTLEFRLWHNNEILLQQNKRIFPLPVGSGWRTIRSSFVLNKKEKNIGQQKLEIIFRVDCTENFFGSGCEFYCKLTDWERFLNRMECNNESGLKECKKGWIGDNCSIKIDNNVLNPTDNCYCINGGKCVDNKCLCPTGYWGNNCEKCIPSSRCKGFCRQRPGECSCPEGKGGQFCEKDLIFCSKNSPCQNGGICQNNPEGNYTCKCTPGYGGKNCEKRLTNCEEEPCYNGAKCVPLSSSEFRCLCSPFNFGRFCEVKALNGCRDLPCKNNGTCINLFNLLTTTNYSSTTTKNIQQNSFKCLCSEEWTGHICEYKNNCLNKPCLNDGTCINSMNSFQCFCTENWEGQYCQNKIWKNKKQLNERDCDKCLSSKEQLINNNNLLIIFLLLIMIVLLLAFLSLFYFILRFLSLQIFGFNTNNLIKTNKNKINSINYLNKQQKRIKEESEHSSENIFLSENVRYVPSPTTKQNNNNKTLDSVYEEIDEQNLFNPICQHRF